MGHPTKLRFSCAAKMVTASVARDPDAYGHDVIQHVPPRSRMALSTYTPTIYPRQDICVPVYRRELRKKGLLE